MALPVGLLMKEHRLIERMIALIKRELERAEKERTVDLVFIRKAVDFMRTYADRCHHGKEEDILFRKLAKKELSEAHKLIMVRLVSDHKFARKTVGELLEASEAGEVDKVIVALKKLVELYPEHINVEDGQFFLPVMDYFDGDELRLMMKEFAEFDRGMIHWKYEKTVEALG